MHLSYRLILYLSSWVFQNVGVDIHFHAPIHIQLEHLRENCESTFKTCNPFCGESLLILSAALGSIPFLFAEIFFNAIGFPMTNQQLLSAAVDFCSKASSADQYSLPTSAALSAGFGIIS